MARESSPGAVAFSQIGLCICWTNSDQIPTQCGFELILASANGLHKLQACHCAIKSYLAQNGKICDEDGLRMS